MTVIARNIAQVKAGYGIGRSTVYELLAAGILQAKKAGGRTLITEASLQAWWDSLPPHTSTHVVDADCGGQRRKAMDDVDRDFVKEVMELKATHGR